MSAAPTIGSDDVPDGRAGCDREPVDSERIRTWRSESSPEIRGRARRLRGRFDLAEDALWQRLRGRRLHGAKFRRQHPVGPFIVDFVCLDAGPIVEVDGAIHQRPAVAEHDAGRDGWLRGRGFHVLRLPTTLIRDDLNVALTAITVALKRAGGRQHPEPRRDRRPRPLNLSPPQPPSCPE
jgi:very-short-patch-repair endonuclease